MTIGLALALMVRALIGGVEFAGHLTSQQIGFSYAATVDPASGVAQHDADLALRHDRDAGVPRHQRPSRDAARDGDVLFRTADRRRQHQRVAADESCASCSALVFTVGLRLAAPIVIVLLIVELAVGLISRAAPALNFMVIGYPVRIIVGLTVLAALLSTIPSVTASLTEQAIELALRFAAAFR